MVERVPSADSAMQSSHSTTFFTNCSAQSLCAACLQYEAGLNRVRQLEIALAEAKDDAARLGTAKNMVHDPLSKLPRELFSRILEVLYERRGTFASHRTSLQSPFRVIATSHTWREVALSTPNIWSGVQFVLDRKCKTPQGMAQQTDLLGQYIANSRDLPLTIELRWDDKNGFSEFPKTQSLRLVDLLLSWVHRWRAVKLTLNNRMKNHMLEGLPAFCPPNLRTLWLTGVRTDEYYEKGVLGWPGGDWSAVTSGLKTFIVGRDSGFTLDCTVVNCTNLEEIQACASSIKALYSVLGTSPKLRKAKIYLYDSGYGMLQDGSEQPMVHHTLQQLELHIMGKTDDTSLSLFSLMTFPNLENFIASLRCIVIGREVGEFLSRCPNLRRVTFTHNGGRQGDIQFEDILDLPLEVLTFTCISHNVVSDLLEAVFPSRGRKRITDSLRQLILKDIRWDGARGWDFIEHLDGSRLFEHHEHVSDAMPPASSVSPSLYDIQIEITIKISKNSSVDVYNLKKSHLEAIEKLKRVGISMDVLAHSGSHSTVQNLVALSENQIFADSQEQSI